MSLLLSLLIACQQPAPEVTPGVIPETGALIATVNGNKVTEGVVDAVLAQVPESQREEIKSGPQYSRLKEQLVTTEILYREALKQGLDKQEDIKVAMAFSQREVLANAVVTKLSLEAATEEKMKAYYDDHAVQYRKDEIDLSMIVLASEAEAQTVKMALDAGEDFATLAKEKSIDPQAKSNGGAVGFVPKSQLPPPLQAAITSLEIGTASEPVNMGGAFGVLKVNGKNEGVTPYEEVKEEIKQAVVQEESQTIVKSLRDAATVEMAGGSADANAAQAAIEAQLKQAMEQAKPAEEAKPAEPKTETPAEK